MNLKTLDVASYIEEIKQKGKEYKKEVIVTVEESCILVQCEEYLLKAQYLPDNGGIFNGLTINTTITALSEDAGYTVQVRKTFQKTIGVLAAYWNGVASLNNLESVLFLGKGEKRKDFTFSLDVLEKYSSNLTKVKKLDNKALTFLKEYYKVYGLNVICASLTENHVQQIKKFLPAVSEFLDTCNNYPLITENYRSEAPEGSKRYYILLYPTGEYNGSYCIAYGGRGFRVRFDKDYKNVEFFTVTTINKETNEKKKEVITTKPLEKIHEGFEEVIKLFKEEERFSHLINPPKKQFYTFTMSTPPLPGYKAFKDTHASLIEKVGNWEVIEEDFAYVNKKREPLKILMSMYDSVKAFRIEVYECVAKHHKYYFVSYSKSREDKKHEEFYMLTTNDLNDNELYKSKVTELLFKDDVSEKVSY